LRGPQWCGMFWYVKFSQFQAISRYWKFNG
jgi:hypothetical protein